MTSAITDPDRVTETLRLDTPAAGVMRVTLDRPPVNAVNRQMVRELAEVFERPVADRDTRVVILEAAGNRAFCAGVDLNEAPLAAAELPPSELLSPGANWRRTQHVIRNCPVPVIAAVERAAIGAGFGLVGLCDIIVASSTATFGLTEINVGLLGGASKALRMVGPYKTRAMMLSGELVPAAEMHRFGVIETVTDPGGASEEALLLATATARKSPIAVRLLKESILRIEGDQIEDDYRTEWDYTNRIGHFADAREALNAYRQKRAPSWTWT